jgi:ribosomal protein S18 acetylase RimI-like enzyme
MDAARIGLAEDGISLRACDDEPIEMLRDIHEAIFPIRFEDDFFEYLASGRFRTLGAYRGEHLIGIVVWDVTSSWHAERHDGPLFSRIVGCGVGADNSALYILTLGVRVGQRRRGLGRTLLEACLDAARAKPGCVCAYLHVLKGNARATQMYESARFVRLRTVRGYYSASTFIQTAQGVAEGDGADALVYAFYLRAGVPPASLALCRSWRLVCSILAGAITYRAGDSSESDAEGHAQRQAGPDALDDERGSGSGAPISIQVV